MHHSEPPKRLRASQKGFKNALYHDAQITNEELSRNTLPQLISALLSKVESPRTYIAESSDSLASVLAEVEKLQIKLVQVAIALKVRQNANKPINMVPPEVLVEIFRQVYPLPIDFPPSVHDYPHPDDLVNLSHVCSHWRQTALACPSLWSAIHVSPNRARHAMVFLQRSRRTSLRIFVSSNEEDDENNDFCRAIEALEAHSHRFIECHFFTDSWDVHWLVKRPFPFLEAFSSALYSSEKSLPILTAPRLRRLAYSMNRADRWATHCTNLTHLSLHQIFLKSVTITSIFEALRRASLLEVLKMDFRWETEIDMDVTMQPTFLDHLRQLQIGVSGTKLTDTIANIVDALVIPPRAEICIWSKLCYGSLPHTISHMLSAVFKAGSRHWAHIAQITRIDICPPHPHFAAVSTRGSGMVFTPYMSDTGGVSKCFPLPTWFPSQLDEIVLWGNTREGWPVEPSADNFASFLHSIPRIHTLTLCGDDLNTILQAVEIASSQEETTTPELLPNAESRLTTGGQIVGSRKYFPQVRSLSMPSEGPPRILPT